jgi:hypothetical protein
LVLLAEKPEIIKKAFKEVDIKRGKYTIALHPFLNKEEILITVDDYVPFRADRNKHED